MMGTEDYLRAYECAVCGAILLVEVDDDGHLFDRNDLDCPHCGAKHNVMTPVPRSRDDNGVEP